MTIYRLTDIASRQRFKLLDSFRRTNTAYKVRWNKTIGEYEVIVEDKLL